MLELDDIQGLLARGYGRLPYARFLMMAVTEAGQARRTLAAWSTELTAAADETTTHALNIALTAPGIRALTGGSVPAGFSDPFASGMVTAHRSRLLGDVDAADPGRWRWGGPGTATIHILVLLYATDQAGLDRRTEVITGAADRGGLAVVTRLDTMPLSIVEPFGFHDGISQPRIEGLRGGDAGDPVRAGEFILGYPNEYGQLTERPLLPPTADPGGILPRVPGSGAADLGRNGSYLVFRQLSQDVDGFWRYLDNATRRPDGTADPDSRLALAAKMVGRWPGGASLVLSPDRDDPALAYVNDFGYHHTDPLGLACPIGSHVRRANPRDSLEPAPGTSRALEVNRRHRLLRRGRAYHTAAPNGAEMQADEHGLHFICLNANIARQYEFVQHSWIDDPAFNGLHDDPDPVVGARHRGGIFTVPDRPVRRRYGDLPQFVQVRGGGYFFLPGITALRYLAGAAE